MADPIRAAIVDILSSVPNIGRVQAYERYAERNAELTTHYSNGSQLLGWFVRRVGVLDQPRSADDCSTFLEVVRWQIRGYMALDDAAATELAFDELLNVIRGKFRSNITLNGTVMTTFSDQQAGIAVEDSGPVLFGGVLCHAARLNLITKRYF